MINQLFAAADAGDIVDSRYITFYTVIRYIKGFCNLCVCLTFKDFVKNPAFSFCHKEDDFFNFFKRAFHEPVSYKKHRCSQETR